jgi:hypothetical protein
MYLHLQDSKRQVQSSIRIGGKSTWIEKFGI